MAGEDDETGPPGPHQDIARAFQAAEPIGAGPVDGEPAAEKAAPKAKRTPKPRVAKAGKPADESTAKSEAKPRRKPQRDGVMALTADCDLWHDADGEAFCTFDVKGHRENWPVRSDTFKRWLAARAYEKTGAVPGSQAVEDTLRVLEARATTDGRHREPWLRVGALHGFLYIDLCDAEWQVIEIGPNGWNLIKGHGLPFVRCRAMRALCEPEAGSEINILRRFVNVATDEDFLLVVAWLVAALRETGPYPILVVNGEQGSGKSTFSKLIRSLVDPNAAPIRAVPKDPRDLLISAGNAHILCMDNLSRVEPWLSDGLCSIATGAGYATRKLMSDRDESVFMASRPIILNGIPTLTDRADLASRAVTIQLSAIPDDERRPEDEFWADWAEVAPRVLGSLCDGLCSAVKRVGSVRLERAPRLADFVKWMTAAEPGLGWDAGTFVAAYADNQREVTQTAFEADPVAIEILRMVEGSEYGWEGTAADLLAALTDAAPESAKKLKSWPVTSMGIGNRLSRCGPLLRAKGWQVERKHSGVRKIRIAPIPQRGA